MKKIDMLLKLSVNVFKFWKEGLPAISFGG